ncbi:hypothetical protein JCGZ_07410 [Jatropha curcas]|uniref:DUF4408 domain-containing protein n=1 Tax=Jatropha curcas TaxID=180498 RepID=A0A067KPU9_JATCU|nr:pathogen-associated molecular patterns-induced protein A70 [Jatropha curcas]KDP33839.1 hypothetical protein JCGZ_07410 [Jatropha curcas]
MAEPQSSTSMGSLTSGWFTPASLFLLLNIVIGTIALTSRFGSKRREQEEIRPLVRGPSLIERVKSINLYSSPDSETQREAFTDFLQNTEPDYTTGVDRSVPLERAPSLLERVKSIKFSSFYRSEQGTDIAGVPDLVTRENRDQSSSSEVEHHVTRSKSESRVAPERQAPEKMKKSASERVTAAAEEEEDRDSVERRRPATTSLEKKMPFVDEAVDAKADDFINRFKQQLKLQRLDSLLRYRDMLRGK